MGGTADSTGLMTMSSGPRFKPVVEAGPGGFKNSVSLFFITKLIRAKDAAASKAKRITRRTGTALKHWIAPKKHSFTRWLLDCLGILLTREKRKEGPGPPVAAKTGATAAPVKTGWIELGNAGHASKSWGDAPRVCYQLSDNVHYSGGNTMAGSSEITGIVSYLKELDDLGTSGSEDLLSQAQAKYDAAQRAAESKHATPAAEELANHWGAVVSSLSGAAEAGDSTASQEHTTYDPVVDSLSGVQAQAAQEYLGEQ